VKKLLLHRRLILPRLANHFGSTYVGVSRRAKLEEIREKPHRVFRLLPADGPNRSADCLRRFGNIFRGFNGAGIDHKGLVALVRWGSGFSRFSGCYSVLMNRAAEVSPCDKKAEKLGLVFTLGAWRTFSSLDHSHDRALQLRSQKN
jgi:hypothetical protein